MNLDRLGDPMALAAGCFLWIPLAIWIVSLVGWMVSGDVDPLIGFAGIGLALVLGYWGIQPPSPIVPPLLLLAATSTVVLFPFVQAVARRSELKEVELESIERAYDVLSLRRDSAGAKLRMAKSLYALGHLPYALAVAETALQGADEKLFREELGLLRSWRNQAKHANVTPARAIECVHCSARTSPEELFCARCGAPVLADFVRGRLMSPRLKSKVLAIWIATVVGMVGFPVLGSKLPPLPALLAIVALCVAIVAMLVLIFRPRSEAV